MKVFCVFTLESSHRGDSNKYTQYTIFNPKNKTKITQNDPKSASTHVLTFSKGLKNKFETAVVNGAIGVRAIEVLLYVHYSL